MILGTVTVLSSYGIHVNGRGTTYQIKTYAAHCKGDASVFIQVFNVEKVIILNTFCSKTSHDTAIALHMLAFVWYNLMWAWLFYLSPNPITIRKSSGLRSRTFCGGAVRADKNGHLISKGTWAVPLKTVLFGSLCKLAIVAVMTVGIKSTEYK